MWSAEGKITQLYRAAGDTQSVQFFTVDDFEEWRGHVLRFLSLTTSPIHDIVHSGHLPIFSKKNDKWFGVTASCKYRGQQVCESEHQGDYDLYERLQLRGLLESKKPMEPSRRYVLQDHGSASFLLLYRRDLVLVDSQDEKEPRLYLNNLYPKRSAWNWLTGGDLLCATAIIFALTRVRYLMVGEGPDLRYFEDSHGRKTDKEYFYYKKFILGIPQHVKRIFDRARAKRMRRNADIDCDSNDQDFAEYEPPEFFERVEKREPDTIMGFWLWENQLWQPLVKDSVK